MKRITFYVGPNGCGKTRQLVQGAESSLSLSRFSIAIANTPFVRFPRSRHGFRVFRVSPSGIVGVVTKNLENFFDEKYRDTFDITDLLEIIGFHPTIALEIKLGEKRYVEPDEVTSDLFELDAINSSLEILRGQGGGRIKLSNTSDSFLRSLRGQNRVFFKHIGRLKRAKVVSSYSLVFHNRKRGPERFEDLSSGEQTLISTYLFIKANLPRLESIFIDEPENSLHPEWQKKYLEMLHMALGYHDVRIFLATHSPVLVSGALASYDGETEILRIEGDQKSVLEISHRKGPESVEEILWQAFDTITPANHFLSIRLSTMLQDLSEGRIDQKKVTKEINQFMKRSYDRKQREVLRRALNELSRFSPNADIE